MCNVHMLLLTEVLLRTLTIGNNLVNWVHSI